MGENLGALIIPSPSNMLGGFPFGAAERHFFRIRYVSRARALAGPIRTQYRAECRFSGPRPDRHTPPPARPGVWFERIGLYQIGDIPAQAARQAARKSIAGQYPLDAPGHGPFKAQFFFHLAAYLFRLFPMLAGPDGFAGSEAHPAPHDVKMLPPIEDMFDDHSLMIARLISILLLAAGDDFKHLFIGQSLIPERVDADMMQGLLGLSVAGDGPHIMEGFIQIRGGGIADLDKADFLVLAYVFQIIRRRPIAAPDVALDNHGLTAPGRR
ncbi:MAG TPA: hypothetical protein VMV79_07505 [Alphaproteobacteria bacterium]|nr:hypothetical protein [Alphaproteobacteria bacterium]